MGRPTWNQPIDKHTAWGGDASTSGLPVCGERIEEFIKETFEDKVGCIYYDTVNNRYMMFADEENRDLYLSDPETYATYLLGVFDAPFNYTGVITLIDTPTIQFVDYDTTGIVIKAEFDTLNKSGDSVGEAHTVTITFKNGSSSKEISRQVSYGSTLSINVDEYLNEGTNNITIRSVGNDTLASTSQVVVITMVKLELNDYFDISYPYNSNDTLAIDFDVKGSGLKHMLWWVDGVAVEHDTDVDDITATESAILTRYIPINLSQGRHNLQFRAYVEVNGHNFYTDVHYRDFIVKTNENVITVASFDYPLANNSIVDAFTMPIPMYGLKQYEAKNVKFAIYNPLGSTISTTVSFNGKESTYTTNNEAVYSYQINPTASGSSSLSIATSGATALVFISNAEASSFNLHEISNCIFRFNGTDRTNDSANRNQWSYSGYSAYFNGFTWNESNGWVGDGFLIGNGQTLNIAYSPLANVSVNNGATIEFDYSTLHVMDEDAVICDIRENGVGILITASEAKIISRGGVELSTKYKSGEQVRVSFVINRYSMGNNKGLVFIYVNGILSGAVPYGDGESFVSNAIMSFAGSNDAYIKINQIMAYNRPLTYNEILNNFILYQNSFDNLIDKYNKNDVYTDGTETLSVDKVSAKVPVIIITGDLEALQNTTDKNKEVMMSKIEIINMNNPTLNLTLTDAIMRPQGTSSMSYPKKNFRIYSKRNSRTKMYDYQGNEVTDRLYAFTENAQRVSVWCLKADYAESSSAHNTGVARLWNEVLKDIKINNLNEHYYSDNQFVGRTQAQQIALDTQFEGDVRTCIDGFPICLFYHLNENDPLIFVGKYNFNNDKSTESVFGFTGIPGFDNSHVECWEVTENGSTLALFTNVSNFDKRYSECFESRYPDDAGSEEEANRAQGALKTFATWVNSTSGNTAKFSSEKWDHLDVYKMAAYYIYAMRFGAVDQIVKNSMLTTEDGIHWYFINYDNDTILGLRNDGLLKFGPDITRQSLDPSDPTSYCYAGHDSVLWNNFEADTEFMDIVSEVDKALYNAGLTYGAMIQMFNEKQSEQWGERIYNIDEQYKYLDVWNQTQNNQLEKLQGSRESHREWWINNRFSKYDELNLIGSYKDNNIEIKPTSYGVTGATINIRPASNGHYFGYGINNNAIESGISGSTSADITFVTPVDRPLYIGDPIRFYNAKNIAKFDASLMAPYIQEATFSNISANGEDSFLNEVILGSSALTNNTVTQLGSISNVKYLKNLDIKNFQAINTLNLSNNYYLENLNADGCSAMTSIVLPEAAPITALTLPGNLQTLVMKDLNNLSFDNFNIDGYYSLGTIHITNCPNVTSSSGITDMIMDWLDNKTVSNPNCDVKINGINWTLTYNEAYYLGEINADGGSLDLGGHIHIDAELTFEQMNVLRQLYGNNCFDSDSSFYFTYNVVPLSNLTITLDKNVISKNDTLTATVSFTGNDFKKGVFTLSDNDGISVLTSGFTAIISTGPNVEMKDVSITYTVTKLNNDNVSVAETFKIVPYEFYLNNTSFNDIPTIIVRYEESDTAKTITDGWLITCDDEQLNFSISSVTINGGSAQFSGHSITQITKTTLVDNTYFTCYVNLTFNGETIPYAFRIKTELVGYIINTKYNITNISLPVDILYSGITLSNLRKLTIDGVDVEPATKYLFVSTGVHEITYEFIKQYDFTNAFSGITSISEIRFDDSITSIGNYAFANCLNLNKIYINKETAPAISANTFYYNTISSTIGNTLYIPMNNTGYTTSAWTQFLLNQSYGNFQKSYILGWTGDEDLRILDGVGTVSCNILNNTGKEISAVTVTSSNSNITVSNVTNNGFILNINITATTSSTITGVFTFTDGTEETLSKNITVEYYEIIKPFVLYNSSNSSVSFAISGDTYRSAPPFDIQYQIVDDYVYGNFDDYNFDETRYQQYTFKSNITLPAHSTVFLRSNTMNTWYNNSSGRYYFYCSYTYLNQNVLYGEGNFSALVANNKNLTTDYCLNSIFKQFWLLNKVRELNFTSVTGQGCLSNMFERSRLVEAPELPATDVGPGSYGSMFAGCTYLTKSPTVLPALSATISCYSGMFSGCTNMSTVPEIMATAATYFSYNAMFDGCQNIVSGAVCHTTTLIPIPSSYGYKIINVFNAMYRGCINLEYAPDILVTNCKIDGNLEYSETVKFAEMFRGCTKLTHAPNMTINNCNKRDFYRMFYGCTSLVDASNIVLKGLNENSFHQMFMGCSSLTGAPIMSGITAQILTGSYMEMFRNCTSLVNAPEINSTSIATSGCQSMFYGCTSLENAPILKPVKPANSAYNTMFYNCNNLTGITIQATALTNTNCVNNMITSPKLNTLTFTSATAPGGGTNMFTPNVGTNSGTSNVIYVPQGATGYESASYLTNLLDPTKGNFTISATL